jgi:hypothetical protein
MPVWPSLLFFPIALLIMLRTIFILALSLSLAACGPAKLGLDSARWSKKQELAVKGRQGILIKQKLSFGEFKTATVKRSWTRGSTEFAGWAWGRPGYEDYARIIGTEYSNKKQSLRFELSDDKANQSSVFCVTRAQSEHLVIGKNPNSLFNIASDLLSIEGSSENFFWVKIYLKNDEQPWEMLIDNEAVQRQSKTYTGVVAQGRDKYYTIHPINTIAGKDNQIRTMPFGSIGFEIRNKEGKPLAAVSMMDKGTVYFNPLPGPEKFLVANICAALLLQEVIG